MSSCPGCGEELGGTGGVCPACGRKVPPQPRPVGRTGAARSLPARIAAIVAIAILIVVLIGCFRAAIVGTLIDGLLLRPVIALLIVAILIALVRVRATR